MKKSLIIFFILILHIPLLYAYMDIGMKITNNPVIMEYNDFDIVWFGSFSYIKNITNSFNLFLDGDINLYSIYYDISYINISLGTDFLKYMNKYDKIRFIVKMKGETDIYADEYKYWGLYEKSYYVKYIGNFMIKPSFILDYTNYPNMHDFTELYLFPSLRIAHFFNRSSVYFQGGGKYSAFDNTLNRDISLVSLLFGISHSFNSNKGIYARIYYDNNYSSNYSIADIPENIDDYFISPVFYDRKSFRLGYNYRTQEKELSIYLEIYNKKFVSIIYTGYPMREDNGIIINMDYLLMGINNDIGFNVYVRSNDSNIKPFDSFTVKMFLGF